LTPVSLLDELEARGLIHDTTDRAALGSHLEAGSVTLYLGIDPTADSLHLGHLMGVLALRRFQLAGHRPIALVGGATGMVGDPSGRSEERNLLDDETLAANVAGIRAQLERLIDFSDPTGGAELANNRDWTAPITVVEFLRDVGKHVTVNQMMAKESVRSRLDGEEGLSYTEFSYMLLQANDYWWLNENKDCTLQVGGSDQWGNITAGIDLIRRRSARGAHGLTWPLLTRADGSKFGKTAEGTIWLSAERTLPYEFHQYLLQMADADVGTLLARLTFVPISEIEALMGSHEAAPEQRLAQRRLADEVTALVHGAAAVAQANLAAAALFGDSALSAEMIEALRGIVPETTVAAAAFDEDQNLLALLVASGLCKSRGDAGRQLAQNAISVNRQKSSGDTVERNDLVGGRFLLLQRGKRNRHVIVVG
jgi:tyrosyl-tRNA synthetase